MICFLYLWVVTENLQRLLKCTVYCAISFPERCLQRFERLLRFSITQRHVWLWVAHADGLTDDVRYGVRSGAVAKHLHTAQQHVLVKSCEVVPVTVKVFPLMGVGKMSFATPIDRTACVGLSKPLHGMTFSEQVSRYQLKLFRSFSGACGIGSFWMNENCVHMLLRPCDSLQETN